jgi:hypothetical protein
MLSFVIAPCVARLLLEPAIIPRETGPNLAELGGVLSAIEQDENWFGVFIPAP